MVSAGSGIPFRTVIIRLFCKSNKNVPTRRVRIRVPDWAQIKVLRARYGGDLGRCRTKFVGFAPGPRTVYLVFKFFALTCTKKLQNVQNLKSHNNKILGENRRIILGMSILYNIVYTHPIEKFLKISKKPV